MSTGTTFSSPRLLDSSATLKSILSGRSYALGISPGFFRFYAYMGVLHALQERELLEVSHVSGSSAGALVGGFLAAGMQPSEMVEPVFSFKREDIWDVGFLGGIFQGGLLQGLLVQKLLEKYIPVKDMKDCKIPFGATAFDVFRLYTRCLYTGDLATNIRASLTFPGLFQPVRIDNWPHIDGGIFDYNGLMALPGVPYSNLIVNLLSDIGQLKLPKSIENIENIQVKILKYVKCGTYYLFVKLIDIDQSTLILIMYIMYTGFELSP